MLHRLITKPEQSGKTFIMLQEMVKLVDSEVPQDSMNINLVLCDNNLMLVLQTIDRVGNVPLLENHIELSSSKRASSHNYKEVVDGIINHGIRNILCCSNYIRMTDISSIIQTVFDLNITDRYLFNIWVDEADKWLGGIDKYISPLIDKFSNIKLNLITATPKRIIKKYGKVEVLPLENATLPQYHSWMDSTFKIYPDIFKTDEFVDHILKTNPCEITPGSKWFIPAGMKKESHILVKEYCKSHGFATIIINGDGLKIYLPDGTVLKRDRDEMPDRLIPNIYDELGLDQFPLAITGYLCISRGITISSPDFQISHAIMPAGMNNEQEISQVAGRTKGNQKMWVDYKSPIIFVTKKFHSKATIIEMKTRYIAENAFQNGKTIIDMDSFTSAEKPFEYYQHPDRFKTYEEAVGYLETQEEHLKPQGSTKTIDFQKMVTKKKWISRRGGLEDGHWISSSLNTNKTIKSGLVSFLHEKTLEILSIYKTVAEPDNLKYRSFVIIPVYKDESASAEDVSFVVRHTKWK